MAHWADEVVDRLPAAHPSHCLATGISPSGEIHVGNFREVMTAAAVHEVLRERAVPAKLVFVADDLDPLRRVYPFLDPRVYEPLIGRSLARLPCPCGGHASYGDHFLAPFLDALRRLWIEPEVVRGSELYASGRMDGVIGEALDATARIAGILAELTGKQVAADWSPFDPRCAVCERLTEASVTGYDRAGRTVSYRCTCGGSGFVPFAGGGKLTWRVDWPARWKVLGVTVEPFGKDHASRGGSYDTGVRIAREVFGVQPPFPVPYEWISLKGKGDMSSSRGNVLSTHDILEVVPPEVLRYLVLRAEPQRTIGFDPGLPLLQLCDELEDSGHHNRNERAAVLATRGERQPLGVPFRHLVTVAQIAAFDPDRTVEVLRRTGHEVRDRAALGERLVLVRRWLERFAPPEVRFAVADELPEAARALAAGQRAFLATLAERLPEAAEGEVLHALIYAIIRERDAGAPTPYFGALYLALIGRDKGPRAGHFLAALPAPFVRQRLRDAAAAA